MTKHQKNQILETIIIFIFVLGTFIYKEFIYEDDLSNNIQTKQEIEENTKSKVDLDEKLIVEFIDVGQADSILIKNKGEYILIDAGNNEDGPKLVNYLKSEGISTFKYVIGTHPHEDHIGGMDDIITNFIIENFYMPDAMTTTKTFEDILDALDSKNYKLTIPKIGENFQLGDANFKILYTGTDTSDLNNTSIVIKMTYGNISYLFTGDATSETEKILLESNADISATVLKVGHHGSQYSTTQEFLNKVNPEYAVIEVGKNNTYDHPKEVTIRKLEKQVKKIYRTDEYGTIVSTTDGNTINWETKQTDTNG